MVILLLVKMLSLISMVLIIKKLVMIKALDVYKRQDIGSSIDLTVTAVAEAYGVLTNDVTVGDKSALLM